MVPFERADLEEMQVQMKSSVKPPLGPKIKKKKSEPNRVQDDLLQSHFAF